jgi:hypothetical protein
MEEIINLQNTDKPRKGEDEGKWSKPLEGVLKLNCDVSLKAEDRSGSWGFLIQDSDGDVVTAGRGKINHLLSAFHAEVVACLHGVQAALNLCIGRLIGGD